MLIKIKLSLFKLIQNILISTIKLESYITQINVKSFLNWYFREKVITLSLA